MLGPSCPNFKSGFERYLVGWQFDERMAPSLSMASVVVVVVVVVVDDVSDDI